jgi:SanA protein
MLKQLLKFLRGLLAALAILGLLALFVPRLITTIHGWGRVYSVETAPADRVAIVFGAGLTHSGQPTPILRDRVETAAQLYFTGKAETLLMSGTTDAGNYSEPAAMRQYALSLGVPERAIVLDNAGYRTYDTCYRAKAVYGLDSALLVTQSFHMPRALFLCNALGLKAGGVLAANRRYWPVMLLIWNAREQIATLGALVDIYISHPTPMLGRPQPILQPQSRGAST